MSDPRLTLIRDGIASTALEGVVRADRYVAPTAMRCARPSAVIRKTPDLADSTEDQLLFGEAFDVLLTHGDFSFGQARRDGYVGFVESTALIEGAGAPTHWVSALRTYAFSRDDLKSPPSGLFSKGSLVRVIAPGADRKRVNIEGAGWMTADHLTPIGVYEDDLVAVARSFLEAPYQWGGRESAGLDCSGLVQQALQACGRAAPRDTDMQARRVGQPVAQENLRAGDLVFWRGHVAMMVDDANIIHANAHHMAVRIESLSDAITRIEAARSGSPTAFRRP